jgi:hypothetical protein
MPALEKAVGAVASIKLIFDTVQLLFQDQMLPVEVGKYNMLKQETEFV